MPLKAWWFTSLNQNQSAPTTEGLSMLPLLTTIPNSAKNVKSTLGAWIYLFSCVFDTGKGGRALRRISGHPRQQRGDEHSKILGKNHAGRVRESVPHKLQLAFFAHEGAVRVHNRTPIVKNKP